MGAIHKFRGDRARFRWDDVTIEGYADPSVAGVTKQVVIGAREGAPHYSVRYFELAPGAKSSFDRHEHDHGVIVLAGSGAVLLGEQSHEIAFGDVIYVGPNETHQFENTGSEPLGFLCVVRSKKPI